MEVGEPETSTSGGRHSAGDYLFARESSPTSSSKLRPARGRRRGCRPPCLTGSTASHRPRTAPLGRADRGRDVCLTSAAKPWRDRRLPGPLRRRLQPEHPPALRHRRHPYAPPALGSHAQGIDAVILDEFHERRLQGDLALALLQRLQRTRARLRIVVMSATLEAEPSRATSATAPSSAREDSSPISIVIYPSGARATARSRSAQRRARRPDVAPPPATSSSFSLAWRRSGARSRDASPSHEEQALSLPLHGDLSPAEQDRAIRPSRRRKVILATNVAETR